AKMRARYGAVAGSYRFKLSYPSIVASDNAGNEYEMWKPTYNYADMYITSGSYSEQVSGGGISLSRSQINTGEMFTVYITVPPIADSATAMSVRFDYDANVFEPVTWNTAVSGMNVYTGSGYYELYYSDNNRPIGLSNGLTLAVTMQSRASNFAGSYTFRLSQSVLTRVSADGNSTVQLWYPSNKSATLNLVLSDALNPYGTKTTTTAAVTTSNVTSTDDEVERIDDDTDDPTDPTDINNDDEPEYIVTDGYDPDEGTDIIDDDDSGDDTTSPAVTYKVDFSLSTDLDGLKKGDVLVATKYDFFTGDTSIVLRNTDNADKMALKALERLELTNHEYYAFDISLYDKARGAYIASLGNGYMDFYVPLPKNLEKAADSIGVYHIENGYPEYIKGSVVKVNGQKKVKFRASSFSPYMFVDLVNVKSSAPSSGGNAYIVPTTNNTGSKTGYNGNVNPATGVAAAILIPAALTGCVLLARKQKPHRKRSRKVRNRPEEEQN
ncbi:MAG: hypothetical protein IK093_05460, partial [Ruminiclostridium sp.]|nr:hypothetical protein [Ruminiclostridium sp.]